MQARQISQDENTVSNKRLGIFLGLFLLLGVTAASATIRIATPSGSGNNSGTDWGNACKGFAGNCAWSALVRGDTLYFGGSGHYAAQGTINTPLSGSTLITVKGAIAADHGTDTGWSPSFGVDASPALWDTSGCSAYPSCNFAILTTGYWTFDGQVASDPTNASTYGIQFTFPSCTDIHPMYVGNNVQTINYLTFRYMALDASSCGSTSSQRMLVEMQAQGAHSNETVSHFFCSGASNCVSIRSPQAPSDSDIIEYGYIINAFGDATHHGNALNLYGYNTNVTIRYNRILSAVGTGTIVAETPVVGATVYGNVLAHGTGGNGVIAPTSESYWANAHIYNNTFASNTGSWYLGCVSGDAACSNATGNVVENNIIWNESCKLDGGDNPTHDYNSYLSCSRPAPPETNGQSLSMNPFVASGSDNYHLTQLPVSTCAAQDNTCFGKVLSAAYALDMNGDNFGVNGLWQRGAYPYLSSSGVPSAPVNLAATIQ